MAPRVISSRGPVTGPARALGPTLGPVTRPVRALPADGYHYLTDVNLAKAHAMLSALALYDG